MEIKVEFAKWNYSSTTGWVKVKNGSEVTSTSTGSKSQKVYTSSRTDKPFVQMVKWRLKVDRYDIGEITLPQTVDEHEAMEMILNKAKTLPKTKGDLIQMIPELIYHWSHPELYNK